ncbi:hypothetical protein [Chryseobacterium sp. JAH]|uniref:hypothetical protein n=1 Tax=Chryseobacterium sp. JAH TaxID=1742858 RepID=UPI0007413194|nr:hypothetical protein [Chryseobacterium sp. JAH]KUJ51825.1 hypothetical protein AR685_09340 [Chryseobacterium sp. JAH]
MKVGDIKKGLEPLLDDAFESEELLSKNRNSQFYRRVYIRSLFAYVEGSIWVMKQVCLKAKSIDGIQRKINISEYSILTEESYELKGNGDIKTGSKAINILDNIKFTFKTINKLFNGNLDFGVGSTNWEKLIIAKNVRNRITHPKNEKDMIISDDEILICEEVCSWFNILIHDCFNLFIESGNRIKKQ